MIKKILKLGNASLQRTTYRFASNKMSDLIESLAGRIYQQQLIKDEKEEEILKNYIELTEESYLEHLMMENKLLNQKARKIDPSIILMILPTLEKEEAIREHLLMLYPHVPLLNSKELLLFYQYLLAHKLTSKPKIPTPKSLIDCEGLLIILAELYPKDFLIEWLKQVPLYNGSNTYMISMGAFSIISGLSEKCKTANRKLIDRCFQRIMELFESEQSEVRIGVILLGLEMNVKFAQELIFIPFSLDFREIDGIKISLLVIELDRYLKEKYAGVKGVNPLKADERQSEFEQDVQIDQGVDQPEKTIENKQNWNGYVYNPAEPEHIKFKLEEYLQKLVRALVNQEWKNIIKLHTLVRLFQVLKGKKLQKRWLRFSEKLFSFTIRKEQLSTLSNLSIDELVGIVEIMEELKINKPPLLKNLLVVLSDRLETASKQELIRLSKCLVTYVRVCEDYLLHFRVIIERRKLIFSAEDIEKLNTIFRRVQVLFPKPLTY